MDVTFKKENDIAIVYIKGRIDAISAPEFEKRIDGMISEGNSTFVLDLSELEYISSAGLRSILVLAKRLKSENGKIVFSGLKGPVAEVFKISGFYSIFNVFADEKEALKNM
ncbi:MAG: STAS domain-containing protein [Syntrophorhabdaceae bacterium]|nr:STAS domain-containing protein [Syntrophorhabdaceae bacterium]